MSYTLLGLLSLCLGIALAAVAVRRRDLLRIAAGLAEIERARQRGSDRARLQYPDVDLARCIGCGTCVRACPEEQVLEVIHGQARVVHGARCVGHGLCAAECPVGAIALTLGDLSRRRDIPILGEDGAAHAQPGLFLAGEITGFALIRTAIQHGSAVAAAVDRRRQAREYPRSNGVPDLCVVGAGPAGFACSLEAKRRGLDCLVLDQEALGGTVASYPRRKLVMTQPVDLPLHGRLRRTTYEKEELMDLWQEVAAEHELPIRSGVRFQGLVRREDGSFELDTSEGSLRAWNVCLALGRRGTPRKLGVPGEDLPKVAYSLLDAASYRGRRILVVGGGDSAVEAAMGLAEQPGNEIVLSYRRGAFSRIKGRNEARLQRTLAAGRLQVVFHSRVRRIHPDRVDLAQEEPGGQARELRLANDEVFVMAGGVPPFQLLEASGVAFDPALRKPEAPAADQGPGLVRALAAGLLLSLAAMAWVGAFHEYYRLDGAARAGHVLHGLLRPSRGAGLAFGIGAAALVFLNLAYLARRNPRLPLRFGSLQAWMTGHVATGILALLLALLHSAMAPGQTVGGHALAGLAVLVATGGIGRYFYSFVPRALNGRELALDEVKARVAALSAEWDQVHRAFAERARTAVTGLAHSQRWEVSFLGRLAALLTQQRRLRRTLAELEAEGRREGVSEDHLLKILALARRAHRAALMAAHFEDLRGILCTWRYLHRWVGLLMVLLLAVHVFTALRFAGLGGSG